MNRHYLGFHPSEALAATAIAVTERAAGPQVSAGEIRQFFDLFVPELLEAFLTRPSEYVGTPKSLHKLVEGTAGTIDKAWLSLLHRLLAKSSATGLRNAQALIAGICPGPAGQAEPICGTQVPSGLHKRMTQLLAELQDSESPAHRQQLSDALDELVDIVLENLVVASINAFEPGFVLSKICNATQSICRSASHQVIDRVVRRLDAEQARRLDTVILDSLFAIGTERY